MQYKSKFKNIVFRVTAVLFILVMISFCLLSNLFARYTTATKTGNSAQIAAFSVKPNASYTSPAISFENMTPGESRSYAFSISSKSDVTVKCLLSLETTNNLPLTYSVYGKTVHTDGSYTEIITLAPNQGEVTLSLNAEWQSNENDISYLSEIEAIRLTVTAEQVD